VGNMDALPQESKPRLLSAKCLQRERHWGSLPWRTAHVWGAAANGGKGDAPPGGAGETAGAVAEPQTKGKADAKEDAGKKTDAKEDAAAAEAKANALAVARLGELLLDFHSMGEDGPLWRCVNIGDIARFSRLRVGLEYEPGAGAVGWPAGRVQGAPKGVSAAANAGTCVLPLDATATAQTRSHALSPLLAQYRDGQRSAPATSVLLASDVSSLRASPLSRLAGMRVRPAIEDRGFTRIPAQAPPRPAGAGPLRAAAFLCRPNLDC
jgi:hypothetical protein